MMMLRKTMYDKLVYKVSDFDTSRFILKIQYSTGKSGLEKRTDDADKKIPGIIVVSRFVKKDYNAKNSRKLSDLDQPDPHEKKFKNLQIR